MCHVTQIIDWSIDNIIIFPSSFHYFVILDFKSFRVG